MKEPTNVTPEDARAANRAVESGKVISMPGSEIYEIEVIRACDVIPKQQPWLWPGLIPLHGVTLFAGYGGVGKSLGLLQISSYVSTGIKFSACGIEVELPQGNVIILTAEEDYEYHAVPKLIANGANLEKIHLMKSVKAKNSGKKRFIDLHEQLESLEQKITEIGNVKLIIIDPVSYFIGSLKEHDNQEVSMFIDSLNDCAKKYDLAIIFNKHLRKSSSHNAIANAINEVAGCGSWINAPRLSWLIAPHPKEANKIVLTTLKTNITKKNEECFAYQIRECFIEYDQLKIKTATIDWFSELTILNSNEAMSRENFDKSKERVAIDFVLDYLEEKGEAFQKDVCIAAMKNKITKRSFERVISKLKKEELIISDKASGPGASPSIKLNN